MTVLDALQQANEAAGIPTLAFADIREFNAFMDSFNFSDYPVNVVVPYTSNGTHRGPRRTATIPLQGWVLTRLKADDPVDLRKEYAEKQYIGPMRKLAAKFISRLLNTEIIDPEVNDVTDSIRPEYAFLSMQVFGVSYTVNLPLTENIC